MYPVEIKANVIKAHSAKVFIVVLCSGKKLGTKWMPISRVMNGFWKVHTEEYYAAIKKNIRTINVDVDGIHLNKS